MMYNMDETGVDYGADTHADCHREREETSGFSYIG